MKAWKKLEEFCADYLGWKRLTKQHYGQSQHDIEGNGFKGDCKHYAKHRIHTIKQKADMLYKDDILIFTKAKGTHYEPYNVLVTINIELFKRFLEHYKVDKRTNVLNLENNKITTNLKDLSYNLENIKLSYRKMKKIIKEMEVR